MIQQTGTVTYDEIYADFKWRNPHWANDSRSFRPIDKDTIVVRFWCGAEVIYNYRTKESFFKGRSGSSLY